MLVRLKVLSLVSYGHGVGEYCLVVGGKAQTRLGGRCREMSHLKSDLPSRFYLLLRGRQQVVGPSHVGKDGPVQAV